MSSQKLIVVLGATGNQGGSVVNTYLEQPQWKVRGLTRNTNSDKAKALAERGVEVVAADLDDKSSLESAFAGAHALFIVSDYWGTFGALASSAKPEEIDSLYLKVAEIEKQQLVNALDAAARVPSLERLVLSSLQNASKWSGGKYKHVYHFEFKARAAEYAAETYPELWAKTSIFQAGWFTSNYVSNPMSLPRNVNGTIQFFSNLDKDLKMPYIAGEEDTGPLVKALIESPPGKHLIGYREWITGPELVAAFTAATGLSAEYVALPVGEPRGLLPPALQQVTDDMWSFFNEFGYEARDDPSVIHPSQLENPPRLPSVVDYFKKQDWSFLSKAA